MKKVENARLTGKTRHRATRFRKKLILQVEERYYDNGTLVVQWRDATMNDLLELAGTPRANRARQARRMMKRDA